MRRLLGGVSIILLLAACAAGMPAANDHGALQAALQHQLDALREQHGFPGATASYVLPDGTQHDFATGLSDLTAGTPMQPKAVMLSASNGKMYVGAVAALLAAQERLALGSPIDRWLADEPWFARLPNGPDITMQMLLNHSSGLRDHIYTDGFVEDATARILNGDAGYVFSPEALISYVLDLPPSFPAGEGFAYTDTGFIVAGLVIERAAETDYYAALDDLVLGPMNLSETLHADRRDIAGLVQGYRPEGNVYGPSTMLDETGLLRSHPLNEWTGGGLASTAGDLALFVHKLLHEEALLPGYMARVERAAVQSGGSRQGIYGLGMSRYTTQYGMKWGHGGWYPGYRSDVGYYPAHGFTVSVMVNSDIPEQSDVTTFHDALSAVILDYLSRP